jgi:hypothetical protein
MATYRSVLRGTRVFHYDASGQIIGEENLRDVPRPAGAPPSTPYGMPPTATVPPPPPPLLTMPAPETITRGRQQRPRVVVQQIPPRTRQRRVIKLEEE